MAYDKWTVKHLDLAKHFKIRISRKNTEKHGNSRKFTDKVSLTRGLNVIIFPPFTPAFCLVTYFLWDLPLTRTAVAAGMHRRLWALPTPKPQPSLPSFIEGSAVAAPLSGAGGLGAVRRAAPGGVHRPRQLLHGR